MRSTRRYSIPPPPRPPRSPTPSRPAILDAAPGAAQQVAQALEVGELPGRVLAGGAQQDVVGLVLAQRVVDQVGAEGDLAARFLLAGKAPLDQAGDHRDVDRRPDRA